MHLSTMQSVQHMPCRGLMFCTELLSCLPDCQLGPYVTMSQQHGEPCDAQIAGGRGRDQKIQILVAANSQMTRWLVLKGL